MSNTKVYQINVGNVYKFSFSNMLESINGVYKLLNIMVKNDLIEQGIDIYKTTFEPNGVSKDDYENNIVSEITDTTRIFKIQSVLNNEVIYHVPEFLIESQPEFNIKSYLRLGMAINLGIFDDMETLEWLKNEIEDILKSKAGIDKQAVLFAIEEVWLTPQEYEDIEQQRKDTITNHESIYIKNQNLENEISNLKSLINDYEQLIISLS